MTFSKHQRLTAAVLIGIVAGLVARWAGARPPEGATREPNSTSSPAEHATSAVDPAQVGGVVGVRLEFIGGLEKGEDFVLLDAELDERKNNSDYRDLRRLLWLRWLEVDPEGAVTHYRDKEKFPLHDMANLFGTWARIDAAAALASVDELIEEDRREFIRRGLLKGLAEFDTALFLRHLDEFAPVDVGCREVIEDLLATGRDAALALADKLEGSGKAEALQTIAEHWATEDPEAALAWALKLDETPLRDGALVGVLRKMAKSDPGSIGSYLKEIASSGWAEELVKGSASQLAETDPLAALDWAHLHCSPPQFKNYALRAIVGEVPVESLEPLIAKLTDFGVGSLGSEMRRAVSGRSAEELQSIVTLAGAHPDHPTWKSLGDEALRRWAGSDVRAAMDYIATLGDRQRSSALYREIMPRSHAIDDDYERAFEIAQALPSTHRTYAIGSVLKEVAKDDIDNAVAMANALPEEMHESLFGRIGDGLSQEVPAAAAEWVVTLPAGAPSQEAHRRIANNWTNSEPYVASEWVAALPPGPERDHAVEGLVKSLAYKDVDSAFRWAVTIEDPSSRSQALADVSWTFAEKEPDLGLRTLAETDALTDEERDKIYRNIHRALERED